jgi:hypothetical protein
MWMYERELSGSVYGAMAGFCEHGDEWFHKLNSISSFHENSTPWFSWRVSTYFLSGNG